MRISILPTHEIHEWKLPKSYDQTLYTVSWKTWKLTDIYAGFIEFIHLTPTWYKRRVMMHAFQCQHFYGIIKENWSNSFKIKIKIILIELNAKRSKFEFIMRLMRIWANEDLQNLRIAIRSCLTMVQLTIEQRIVCSWITIRSDFKFSRGAYNLMYLWTKWIWREIPRMHFFYTPSRMQANRTKLTPRDLKNAGAGFKSQTPEPVLRNNHCVAVPIRIALFSTKWMKMKVSTLFLKLFAKAIRIKTILLRSKMSLSLTVLKSWGNFLWKIS